MYECMYVLTYAGACRGQKMVLDPLQLEFQAVVSHSTWVLGKSLQSLSHPSSPMTTILQKSLSH